MYKEERNKLLIMKKWLAKLMPVIVVLLVVLTGIVYAAGARSFWEGFCYTLLIWFILELCVTFGFACGWYMHVKQVDYFRIEERTGVVPQYPFFIIKGVLESFCAGVLISALIGGMISILV